MKSTENSDKTYERNEKIMKAFSLFSVVMLVVAIVFGLLALITNNNYYDVVAVSGFTLFVAPALLLEIAMPAGWHTTDIKSMGKAKYLFYFFVFPAANLWFLAGLNALFHFLPDYHHLARGSFEQMMAYNQFRTEAGLMILGMTVGLFAIGLIINATNSIRTNRMSIM